MKIASKQPLRTYYLIFVAMNIVNACIMLHKIYSHEHLIKGYCVFINVGIINIYSRRFISIEDAGRLTVCPNTTTYFGQTYKAYYSA